MSEPRPQSEENRSPALSIDGTLALSARANSGDKDAIEGLCARAHYLDTCVRNRIVPDDASWQLFWEGWCRD